MGDVSHSYPIDPIAGNLKTPQLRINHALRDPYFDVNHLVGDEEIEARLIGGALLDRDCRQEVLAMSASEFRSPIFGKILEAVRSLDMRGITGFDYGIVRAELRAMGELDLGDYTTALVDCGHVADTLSATKHYIAILRSYRKRLLFDDVLNKASLTSRTDHVTHIDEIIAKTNCEINDLSATVTSSSMDATALADAVVSKVVAAQNGSNDDYLPTGIDTIDDLVIGLRRGGVVTLAARPSTGKSMLATTIVGNVCARGGNVLMFSFEVPKEDVGVNIVCARARVNLSFADHGGMSEQSMARFRAEAEAMKSWKFVTDDQVGLNASQVRARVMRHISMFGTPDLIVVDHLGKMAHMNPRDVSEVAQLGVTTTLLKNIAMEFKTRILLLCQMNRGIEARVEKQPTLADLRGSGKIEEDSDQVWMMHRPFKDGGGDPNEIHLFVQKNKRGQRGLRKLHSQYEYQRMTDMPIRL